MAQSHKVLDAWLAAVLSTPGLTSAGREMLLDDSLRAVDVVRSFEGPIVDVGSGGGVPGIPLAAALPEREVTLLEPVRKKAEFLELWTVELPNLRVVRGRAEEQETDRFGVAVAKALAPPPVAAEWCLPLVRPGGAAILFVGPGAALDAVSRVSRLLGGGPPDVREGLVVLPKLAPTPRGFPRKPGIARKRPLA